MLATPVPWNHRYYPIVRTDAFLQFSRHEDNVAPGCPAC